MKLLDRKTLIILASLIAIISALVFAFRSRSDYDLTVHAPSYHFTFCKITQGTNHVVYRGLPILSSLNNTLARHGHQQLTRDTVLSWPTRENTTCITIGVLREGTSSVLSANAGGHFHSELLSAILIMPDGTRLPLANDVWGHSNGPSAGYLPGSSECIYSWGSYPPITNLSGCEILLTRSSDGKPVATFKLHR